MTLSTPRLDGLLRRLRARLTALVWQHGLGSAAVALFGWLLFAYLADRWLHLPPVVRVVHTAILVGLPLWVLRRELLQRLSRLPDRAGLAVLLEREHPETRDLLVSAVQLAPAAEGSPARSLIERVTRQADEASEGLDVATALRPRGPHRRLALGLGCAAVATLVLGASPAMARIFFARMLGGDVAWPQRTHLTVRLPLPGGGMAEEVDGVLAARVARGSDVTVIVEIEGEVPDRVHLEFEGGAVSDYATGGARSVRPQLRNLQQDVVFTLSGGDDERRTPRVEIEVLEPPDVTGLAFHVRPPAYSGLPEELVRGTDVEVLAGSQVTVHVRPDPPGAHGVARLLGEDDTLALEAAPFPAEAPAEGGAPVDVPGLRFAFVADAERYFQVELVDATGLTNPDPGAYAVRVREDRQPELVLVAPGRAEVQVVPGGALPLRVRVEDDFGLASLKWDVRDPGDPEHLLHEQDLPWREALPEDGGFGEAAVAGLAHARVEVDALDAEGPQPGWAGLLQVVARDNREPEAGEAQSSPVRVRVVTGDDLLRRVKDGLARAGEDAGALLEESEATRLATRDLLSVLGGDGVDDIERELGGLVHEARRVEGDARALGRDLSFLAESLVYSRLDERGGPLLEALDRALAEESARSFSPTPWVRVAADLAAGRLGNPELSGQLVALVGQALEVSEEHARIAAESLAEARTAADPATVLAAVRRAVEAQDRTQALLDDLATRLGEWDNFQSVLTLTRDILNRQKNLNQRTRQYVEDR